jgi:hypothetical protein
MWVRSFLKSLKPRPATPIRPRLHRPATQRLWVETLEDRSLPSGMVSLAVNDDSILVGERVTWTATATDVGAAPVYQFSAASHGGAFHVLRDYSPARSFTWTPMTEGGHDIRVVVKDGYLANETTSSVITAAVGSRVTGSHAVVTLTANPLVALYSVPPSAAETVRVQFALAGTNPAWRNTDPRTVAPGTSTNVFVAGMLPNSTYQMRHVLSDGTGSAPVLFTTGSLPTTLSFPTYTATLPQGPESDTDQDMIFHQSARQPGLVPNPFATDLQGRVTWYYDPRSSGLTYTFPIQSLVSGGTVRAGRVLDEHPPDRDQPGPGLVPLPRPGRRLDPPRPAPGPRHRQPGAAGRGRRLPGLRHPRALHPRAARSAVRRGRGEQVEVRVALAHQGQPPAVAVAEPGHLVRPEPGIPGEHERPVREADEPQAQQAAHEPGRGLVGARLGPVEFGRAVQVDQHRQRPPPAGERERHPDGEGHPLVPVPPGGVGVGRANGVAVPGLAVHRPPRVAVDGVVADEHDRPAGTTWSSRNRTTAHPSRTPDHGGAGQDAAVVGRVPGCQLPERAQQVGDGAPAGRQERPG